jgi:nucleoside-diphosphate-sugar epimerase
MSSARPLEGRRIAITGASGFLGLHLVKTLCTQGADVCALMRRPPLHPHWQDIAPQIVPGDLNDIGALARLVDCADAVIHAAGLIKARNLATFQAINRDGARALAKVARRHAPSARFVAISSLAAREPQLSHYAASKREGENALRDIYADAPQQLVIVRPPAIYGPWDTETLAIFRAAAGRFAPLVGAPDARIAMVHVHDAARAIAALTTAALPPDAPHIYALHDTQPQGYSPAEVIEAAAQAQANQPHLIALPGFALHAAGMAADLAAALGGPRTVFGRGKAREILHKNWAVIPEKEAPPPHLYQPSIGITQGFRDSAAWYRAAGWLR